MNLNNDLENALNTGNPYAVASVIARSKGKMVINLERNAIQSMGCDGTAVSGHFSLPSSGLMTSSSIAKQLGVNPWLLARMGAPSKESYELAPRLTRASLAGIFAGHLPSDF
ncbi:MAG: hypothetical protein ACO1Q7_00400 [Gemmatimonas sp.]